jgi:hypothetical protein
LLDILKPIDIKKVIREFSRSPIGLYLREKLNVYPPAINLRYSEVSSDLFIWRDPSIWNNYFNIAHLGPILNPNYQDSYNALIEFYDSTGSKVGSKQVMLVYGVNKLLDINELLIDMSKSGGNGTFAIFHLADIKAIFNGEKICIAERGFVSYKRKSDKSLLRSYSHGNTNAVAYSLKKRTSRRIGVVQKNKQYFRSQLSLDDAVSSEIALVNFLEKEAEIGIYQYKNGVKEKLKNVRINSGGLAIIQSDIDFDSKYLLEFESKLNFLRPILFKYYENHFDVLHG